MTDASDVQTPTTRTEPGEVSEQVLNAIRELALDLHPEWRRTLIVRLDSDLDRELGYDSLARAELLLRLNRDFQIELPDQLIVDAATPSDICNAVVSAAPTTAPRSQSGAVKPIILPESTAPEDAETLLDVLEAQVKAHSRRPHVYLWHSRESEEALTYGDLDKTARFVAQSLLDKGVEPGDRVAIMLPTSLAFFHAFFGVVMAGAVPVPVYPPLRRAQVEDHLRRQAGILDNAKAVMLIADELTRPVASLLYGLVDSLRRVQTVEELCGSAKPIENPFPAVATETALIQYTSGSTGDPKGVVLSHANLLANIRAMGTVMEANSSDVFVSWLPLYHDMGLIGAWLGTLYYSVPTIIMSPLSFIADPARWLWAIHRHKATLSAAPNFAFELCLKRIEDDAIEGLDLSSLRMVVNGAEPVSPQTIARFTARFGKYGFSPDAMAPVYGLAESSVGLAFPPPRRLPITDCIDRRALSERSIALPAGSSDPNAVEFVACGQPLPGHQIRVVDPTGREAPERQQGRLEFKGPSVTKGYFDNPAKTKALFDGDWLDSGDLAYVAEGDIYLTGRIKDVIIRAGRNIIPHELEEQVGKIEGVRKGCVAVVAGLDEASGTERVVVIAETRLTDETAQVELKRKILEASGDILETPADEIVLVPPHAVPKTSSGKIRRAATRKLYETGQLGQPGRAVWWQLGRLGISAGLGRLARLARSAADYAYAGWWWSVLVGIATVVWPLVLLMPLRRWRHAVIGSGARLLFRLTGIGFTVDKRAPVPERDVIIICNHASYLDGAVVSAAIGGPLTFLVTERFSHQFVAGAFLRRLKTVFVGGTAVGLRDAQDAALAAVRAGERVVIFPEGRLRRMPGLLSFYPGPFLVAAKAGVPVVPVTLTGTRSVLRDSNQWFPRCAPLSVRIGKPIYPDGDDFKAALKLGAAARAEILAHCHEPDLGREEIEFGMLRQT